MSAHTMKCVINRMDELILQTGIHTTASKPNLENNYLLPTLPVLSVPNAWAKNGQKATLLLPSPTLSPSLAFLRAFMSASQHRLTETIETSYRVSTAFARWQSYASMFRRTHRTRSFSTDPWCGARRRTQLTLPYCSHWEVTDASGIVIHAALVR